MATAQTALCLKIKNGVHNITFDRKQANENP
jgi:hypothetical protein